MILYFSFQVSAFIMTFKLVETELVLSEIRSTIWFNPKSVAQNQTLLSTKLKIKFSDLNWNFGQISSLKDKKSKLYFLHPFQCLIILDLIHSKSKVHSFCIDSLPLLRTSPFSLYIPVLFMSITPLLWLSIFINEPQLVGLHNSFLSSSLVTFSKCNSTKSEVKPQLKC